MKKPRLLLISCLFFTFFSIHTAHPQIVIDIDVTGSPAPEVIRIIEEKSGIKVFYNPSELLDISLSVKASQSTPFQILILAFRDTDITVSEFENRIFLLKGKQIITTFEGTATDLFSGTPEQVSGPSAFYIEQKGDELADSEYKVYMVGSPAIQADEALLNGVVVDFKTGDPIADVYVFVENSTYASKTDGLGNYSLKLKPGRYQLIIRGEGRKETSRQVQVYSDGRLNIQSIEEEYIFEEIIVEGNRRDNVLEPILGVEQLKMKEIKNIPTAFGEADIMSILSTLPGVKTVGEISSGFNVRGGATDQNLILFNDGTVYNPTHLFGLFSAINPDIVEDMELYKSSIPAKYGGRISSVLDINGKEGSLTNYNGSASIGLLTSRVAIDGPIAKDKLSFIAAGRTTYSDWILKELPKKSGYSDGRAGFYDFNATLAYYVSERDKITLNGYYSQDRFRFEKEQKYKYRNASGSIKWRHFFNNVFIGSFSAGYDHYDYFNEELSETLTAYNLKFAIDQYYGKADFTLDLNENHRLNFGLNTILYNLNPGESKPMGPESQISAQKLPHERAMETSIYISDQFDITSKLAANLGIRYTLFNVLGPRTYNIYDPQYLPSPSTILSTKKEKGIVKTYHAPEFRASLRYAFTESFRSKPA